MQSAVPGEPAARAHELTTTSFTILGLLALRDWSGYQLTKQIRRGLGQLWPRAARQLYNDPKRLVDAGYVTARHEMVGRRPRTVYSITRSGRAALKRWLAIGSQPPTLEFEGMVRVLMADEGTLEQLHDTLRTMAEQAETTRAEYAGWAAYMAVHDGGDYPQRIHVYALAMRFMIGHFTHIIDWANWALDATSTWPDTTTPAKSWVAEATAIFTDAAHHHAATDERLDDTALLKET